MEWTGIDEYTPFARGSLYRARLAFQGKDAKVVAERCAQFVSKWNSKYKGRFDAKTCSVVDDVIEITGYGVTAESVNRLNFWNFWATHLHVEKVSFYDVSVGGYSGGGNGGNGSGPIPPPKSPGGPEAPGPGAPGYSAPSNGSALPWVLGGVVLVGLAVTGIVLAKEKGSA